MAESYFDMLIEQQEVPARSFDPVEELKRLRRELALRTQISAQEVEQSTYVPPAQEHIELNRTRIIPQASLPLPQEKALPSETEITSLQSVMEKAEAMKKSLVIWQRSRQHARRERRDLFGGSRMAWYKKRVSLSPVTRFLTTPQEETLETLNAGLMALGIVALVFGVLSFFRGLESDLSIGSLVCATGAAIVIIGLGGRFLAMRSDRS